MNRTLGWVLFILVLVGMVVWSVRPRNQGSLVRGSRVMLPPLIPFATFTPTAPDGSVGSPVKRLATRQSPSAIPIPLESPVDRGRWEREKRVLRALEGTVCQPDMTMLFIEDVTFNYQGNASSGSPINPPLEESDFFHYQEHLPSLHLETWVDFLTLNKVAYELPHDLVFKRDTFLGSRPTTYKEPLCGRFLVSRTGFNQDGTQALLYFEYICGSRCWSSQFLLFESNDGGWEVIGEVRLGIA